MRRMLGSSRRGARFPGRPSPVAGSTRMTEPSRPGRIGRRAQVLGAQRTTLGARGRAARCRRRSGGSPQGLGELVLPVVHGEELGAVAAGRVQRRRRGPKASEPTECAGYCWHQSSTSTCSGPDMALPSAVSRDSRPLTTQPSEVRPGGLGSRRRWRPPCPTAAPSRRSRRRGCRGRRRTGFAGKSGSSARPSRPRSQTLWTFVRRSANTSGRGVVDAVEDLDDAALLGDEDAAVGGEAQGERLGRGR